MKGWRSCHLYTLTMVDGLLPRKSGPPPLCKQTIATSILMKPAETCIGAPYTLTCLPPKCGKPPISTMKKSARAGALLQKSSQYVVHTNTSHIERRPTNPPRMDGTAWPAKPNPSVKRTPRKTPSCVCNLAWGTATKEGTQLMSYCFPSGASADIPQ